MLLLNFCLLKQMVCMGIKIYNEFIKYNAHHLILLCQVVSLDSYTRFYTAHFLKIFSWSVGFGLSPYLTTKYAIQHIFYSVRCTVNMFVYGHRRFVLLSVFFIDTEL